VTELKSIEATTFLKFGFSLYSTGVEHKTPDGFACHSLVVPVLCYFEINSHRLGYYLRERVVFEDFILWLVLQSLKHRHYFRKDSMHCN
jgi:hypothetical protein